MKNLLSRMSDFFNNISSTVWNFVQLLVVTVGVVWLVAFIRADVDANSKWNERQDSQINSHVKNARQTYQRKDLSQEQYQNTKEQLDRIESKLDEMNGN